MGPKKKKGRLVCCALEIIPSNPFFCLCVFYSLHTQWERRTQVGDHPLPGGSSSIYHTQSDTIWSCLGKYRFLIASPLFFLFLFFIPRLPSLLLFSCFYLLSFFTEKKRNFWLFLLPRYPWVPGIKGPPTHSSSSLVSLFAGFPVAERDLRKVLVPDSHTEVEKLATTLSPRQHHPPRDKKVNEKKKKKSWGCLPIC